MSINTQWIESLEDRRLLSAAPTLVINSLTGPLAARWWQWAMSYEFDVARNPVLDETGALSHLGQQGNVFMLAGTFTGNVSARDVTIPAGEPIFFPLVNFENDRFVIGTDFNPPTVANLRAEMAFYVPFISDLFATVEHDGHVTNVPYKRLISPVFTMNIPENGVYSGRIDPATGEVFDSGLVRPCVADAYYGLIDGLEVSDEPYVLHFGGSFFGNPYQDNTYTITVTANRPGAPIEPMADPPTFPQLAPSPKMTTQLVSGSVFGNQLIDDELVGLL